MRLPLLLPALALLGAPATAQFLLTVESNNDRVVLIDASNGTVINPAYIDLAPATPTLPIDVQVVGNEIWVTDQTADKIIRFSLDGTTWLGNISGGLDNIRGMALINGEVWVSNAGTNNGAPGLGFVRFDAAGTNLGFYPTGDPFDALPFQGDVLVSDIAGDDITRFTTAGAPLGVFHASDGITGIDFPEQLALRANGNVLAAGFITPAGIYEYDPTGVQLNYWAVSTGPRGVWELGNGMIIYSETNNVKVFDPMTMVSTPVLTGVTARYFTPFAGATSAYTAFCPGDGTGTACPCGNNSAVGADEGCLSSLGTGGKLTAAGNASISADSVVLSGAGMPNSSALYFQGTTQQAGGAGAAFGDGLRCAGGTVIRLKTVTNVAGSSQYPGVGDLSVSVRGNVLAPGTRTYQIWYRNAAAFCTTSTFNLSNGLEVAWGA